MTDLDALIREVRTWPANVGGRLSSQIMFDLAGALETLRAERDAALAREAALTQALDEVHENYCGCDRPGNISSCVAQPAVVFSALASSPPAAEEESCPICGHAWRRHDPEDGQCDAHSEERLSVCQCGRDLAWMQTKIAALSTAVLEASSPPAAEPDDEKLLYASDVAAEMFGPPAAEPEPGEAGVLSSASAPVGSEAQPQGSEPAAEPWEAAAQRGWEAAAEHLAEPYPENIFPPLSPEELSSIVAVMNAWMPHASERMHAQWARHWSEGLLKEAKVVFK